MKIQYVIAIHITRWLTYFCDFKFKWTATDAIGIHPTKAWLSQLVNFKNAIWHFRRTICNNILFYTWKKCYRNVWNSSDCFLNHLAWIEHQFLSGIRDSREVGSLWRMMRCVGGVGKSIHQSWLANWLGFGLLCWGFKGVQQEIPLKEASILQIESVAFPPGKYASQQIHPCHRLSDQDRHQDSSSHFLSSSPCSLWLLVIP